MVTEKLKFYADTSTQKNKFFCWKINSIMDLEVRLKFWMAKMYIKAAWYECTDHDTGEVTNEKIDLNKYSEYQIVTFINKNIT